MNKHKAYWSVMGVEPSEEKSVKQTDIENFERQTRIMMGKYGAMETVTVIRKIVEEMGL